jgi:hypothetical protein
VDVRSSTTFSRERAIDHGLIFAAVLGTAFLVQSYAFRHVIAVDFRNAYWPAGDRLLHGTSPFASTNSQIQDGVAFTYPALAALVVAPFALFDPGTGGGLMTALCITLILATVLVLGVRDLRVYAVVLLWAPTVSSWQSANLTAMLCFGLAIVWRYRDRPAVTGSAIALLISLKPFVWPAALWLLATRRYKAAAMATIVGAAVNLAAWMVVGIQQMPRFVHLSGMVTHAMERTGYGAIALAGHLGSSRLDGTVLEVVLSLATAIACVLKGRAGDDRRAFTLAIALMLLASPLVWRHYLVLLILPLAIAQPQLSPAWLVPMLLWLVPVRTGVAGSHMALVWLVCGWVFYVLIHARLPATDERSGASDLERGTSRAVGHLADALARQ